MREQLGGEGSRIFNGLWRGDERLRFVKGWGNIEERDRELCMRLGNRG